MLSIRDPMRESLCLALALCLVLALRLLALLVKLALVQQLLGTPIPPYVNRLAYFGSFVPQCLLPPQIQDAKAPVDGPPGGGDGYASNGRRYGAGNQNAVSSASAFSGSAMKLGSQSAQGGGGQGGGGGGASPADSAAEKERARNARLAAMEKRAAAIE